MYQSDLFLRIGMALAIGFLIGLERGWHERGEEEGHRAAGIRTFALIGLLGGIFGALAINGDRILISAGFVTTGAAVAAYMWRAGGREKDYSATSVIAALLTFMLGAFALLGDMPAAAGAGAAAVLLLANKAILHSWLQRISWLELRSGLLLAAMTFIALPLLPDRAIDPWGALNPHALWLLTILIAAVSFAGYAAVKIAGPERGLLLAATLGGLVTSTAVTLSLARLARINSHRTRLLAAAILAAGAVMPIRILAIAGLINLPLARELALPLLAGTAGLALVTILYVLSDRGRNARAADSFVLKNPFDLAEVLKFGILLTAVTVAVVLVRQNWGDAGLLTLAALSGLADVDAITLSVARLGTVEAVAIEAILVTALVNTLAKNLYAFIAGGPRLGFQMLAGTAVSVAAALAAWKIL